MKGAGHLGSQIIDNQKICAAESFDGMCRGGGIAGAEFDRVVLIENGNGGVVGHRESALCDRAGDARGQKGFAQTGGAIQQQIFVGRTEMFREAAAALEIRLRHLTRREAETAVRLRAVVVQPEGREGFFVNGQQGG